MLTSEIQLERFVYASILAIIEVSFPIVVGNTGSAHRDLAGIVCEFDIGLPMIL